MVGKTLVPVEEYLGRSFDGPDREYVDGVISERGLGSKPHSKGQMSLIRFFDRLTDRHSLHIFPEMRVKISAERYPSRILRFILQMNQPGTYRHAHRAQLWKLSPRTIAL